MLFIVKKTPLSIEYKKNEIFYYKFRFFSFGTINVNFNNQNNDVNYYFYIFDLIKYL